MLMPHTEPYVVASVRAAIADLPVNASERDEVSNTDDPGDTDDPDDPDDPGDAPTLEEQAKAYVAQEAQHHAQHRRFNDILLRHYPGLDRPERAMAWVFARLRRRSGRFGLAFAAGFECIAFIAARWVDQHQRLLRDADPTAVTLFMWHLAEEVEHKEVAWDVYEASGGGRLRYAWATWVAGFVLAGFSLWSAWVMMWSERRFFNPVAHLRLTGWSLSFIFVAVPVMVVSSLPGHHPRTMTNPAGFDHWLETFDPETGTVAEWALP